MEQELLKKLEKSAETFDEKSKKIDSIEKEVNGLPEKLKAISEKIPDVAPITESLKVMKDEADKNQKALDKLLGQQNEMKLGASQSKAVAVGIPPLAEASAFSIRRLTLLVLWLPFRLVLGRRVSVHAVVYRRDVLRPHFPVCQVCLAFCVLKHENH